MKRKNVWQRLILTIISITLFGCNTPATPLSNPEINLQSEAPPVPTASEEKSQPDALDIASETPSPTPLPPKQPVLPPIRYGPNPEDFPDNKKPFGNIISTLSTHPTPALYSYSGQPGRKHLLPNCRSPRPQQSLFV